MQSAWYINLLTTELIKAIPSIECLLCAKYFSKSITCVYMCSNVTCSIWQVEELGSEWWNNWPKAMTCMSSGPLLEASPQPWFLSVVNFSVCKTLRVVNYILQVTWRSAFIQWIDAKSVLICIIQEAVVPAGQRADSLICVTQGTFLVEWCRLACLFPTIGCC